ncbi:RNA-binding cell elongation regulator Jag/EloR [Bacillus pinisoli]|uniref:RNA-binding cell elongation regulator Jag/EloR n=1 Tax=Bacillus pinisoli TaxID=2901866 RepID=UPI001FF15684
MKEITATGHSVDEALQTALAQLQAKRDEVDIEVVDEGKKGFLGLFGARLSVVKVKVKVNPIKEAKQFIENVIRKMGIQVEVVTSEKDREVTFQLTGKDIALLIGKRGQTLNSLQYLAQLVFNRHTNQFTTIIIDAENYRSRRKETLEVLAGRLADKAIKTGKEVSLEPMPSFERKIIHATLIKNKKVKTFSTGEEPYRHLVITPKKP